MISKAPLSSSAFLICLAAFSLASPNSRQARQLVTCPGFAGFCSEAYPGDICTVVCSRGRPNVPECQPDGTWTDIPRCIEHDPGVPEQVPGTCPGIPGYCSNDVTGGLCEFQCAVGPHIRSFCTPDGTWDPYPVCQGDIRETQDGCNPCPGPPGAPRNRTGFGAPNQPAAAPFQNNRQNFNNQRRPSAPAGPPLAFQNNRQNVDLRPRPPSQPAGRPFRNNNNNRQGGPRQPSSNGFNDLSQRRSPPSVIQPARETPFVPHNTRNNNGNRNNNRSNNRNSNRNNNSRNDGNRNTNSRNGGNRNNGGNRSSNRDSQNRNDETFRRGSNPRNQPNRNPGFSNNQFGSGPVKVGGRCPGGALENCIDVCPSFSARIFGACVAGCARRCPDGRK